MEHAEAIELRAAERYVLKQLTNAEADAFEEHFFSCLECAEEVRWIAMIEDNVKRVERQRIQTEFVTVVPVEPERENVALIGTYLRHMVLAIRIPADMDANGVSLAVGGATVFDSVVPKQAAAAGRLEVMFQTTDLDAGRHELAITEVETGRRIVYPLEIRFA
jgi:anti-sigma factor RsiW